MYAPDQVRGSEAGKVKAEAVSEEPLSLDYPSPHAKSPVGLREEFAEAVVITSWVSLSILLIAGSLWLAMMFAAHGA